jgi:hypothetical protein
VIRVTDGTAEINWRCTGALVPTQTVAPTSEPSPTATPIPTAEPTPTATPEVPADWSKYNNVEYGFGFRYPPTWQIELLSDRPERPDGLPASNAIRLTQESLVILIEYKSSEEGLGMGPGSLPEGDLEDSGTVRLLERALPKHVIVLDGRDVFLFVGDRYPDIEFYIQMLDERDLGEASIPASAQAELEQILATFRRTGPSAETDLYPDWGSHTILDIADGLGFALRYPPDWTLVEIPEEQESSGNPTAPAFELRKDDYVMTVQYKAVGDEATIGQQDLPDGVVSEAGTATLLNVPAQRSTLVNEGKLKMVWVTYSDDVLEIYVTLTADPDGPPYDDVDLPLDVLGEMDQILASSKRTADQP